MKLGMVNLKSKTNFVLFIYALDYSFHDPIKAAALACLLSFDHKPLSCMDLNESHVDFPWGQLETLIDLHCIQLKVTRPATFQWGKLHACPK